MARFPQWPQDGLWRLTILVAKTADDWRPRLGNALVAALREEPSLCRLVSSETLPDKERPALLPPSSADGMVELWFSSPENALEVLAALERNPEFVRAAGEVIAPRRSVMWLARCVVQVPEAGETGIKFLGTSEPAEGLSTEEAQAYWRDVHPVVAREAGAFNTVCRYIQFHGVPTPEGMQPGPLGHWRMAPISAEAGFRDFEAMTGLFGSETYARIVRPDEEKFSQPGDMLVYLTDREEHLLGA